MIERSQHAEEPALDGVAAEGAHATSSERPNSLR